jgi:hypothetical protein
MTQSFPHLQHRELSADQSERWWGRMHEAGVGMEREGQERHYVGSTSHGITTEEGRLAPRQILMTVQGSRRARARAQSRSARPPLG